MDIDIHYILQEFIHEADTLHFFSTRHRLSRQGAYDEKIIWKKRKIAKKDSHLKEENQETRKIKIAAQDDRDGYV